MYPLLGNSTHGMDVLQRLVKYFLFCQLRQVSEHLSAKVTAGMTIEVNISISAQI